MTKDLIQTIGIVIGVILSIPALVALIKLTMFISKMESGVTNTAHALKAFIDRADQTFTNHGQRIGDGEVKIAVLWDGHERRIHQERRQGHG